MSCDSRRRRFFKHLVLTTPNLVRAFGSPEQAETALEQIFAIARSEVPQTGPSDRVMTMAAELGTRALFAEMQRAQIEAPTHAASGLPRKDAQRGYQAIHDTLQALRNGQPLPEVAEHVRFKTLGDAYEEEVPYHGALMSQIERLNTALMEDPRGADTTVTTAATTFIHERQRDHWRQVARNTVKTLPKVLAIANGQRVKGIVFPLVVRAFADPAAPESLRTARQRYLDVATIHTELSSARQAFAVEICRVAEVPICSSCGLFIPEPHACASRAISATVPLDQIANSAIAQMDDEQYEPFFTYAEVIRDSPNAPSAARVAARRAAIALLEHRAPTDPRIRAFAEAAQELLRHGTADPEPVAD